ncbi:MAG: anhydro-N-acetylmuramic acid kinase, partial [Pseudomonadota bacterium]
RPKRSADRFGLPVVFDLRQADMAAGGEGAPLVPAYHRALVRAAALAEPVLVINLGGVANITFIDGDTLIAFDTGPASAMIDDAVAETGKPYDEGGRIAASGTVDPDALAALLNHPFFGLPAPKSLDRDAFSPAPVAGLAFADSVATLTAFSAEALAQGAALLPRAPRTVIAAGGGTHNRALIGAIERALKTKVESADAAGFSSDFMEAEAFAYLAVRSVRGSPITFPGTTGVPEALTGGRLILPNEAAGRTVSTRSA